MIISKASVIKKIPKRSKKSSKIDGGKVLIIGGGKKFYGAGILSALAATRSGAGYTHLMTELNYHPWTNFPDFIFHPFKSSELKNKSEFSIGIGPGLGTTLAKKNLLLFLLKNKYQNVVVDADALTILSKLKNISLPPTWILTPHEGELARLLKIKSEAVKNNRIESLIKAYKKFNCTIILKGAETLIISPENSKMFINTSGTRALAKAGTGDVLLGMLCAFKAQGMTSLDSAKVATFIHGQASKDWQQKNKNDYLSFRPIDLIEQLPKTIYKLRGTK